MRNIRYSLLTLFALLFSFSTLQAQLFEDFESAEKAGYAGGSVEFETGTWYLEDALNRSDGGGDLKNGSYSVRIRDGFLRMDFDKTGGVNEFSFLAGNSGFNGDGGGKLQVYYSTDDGGSWTALGDEITLTNQLDSYTLAVAMQDDIRFRINKTEGGRVNIDDVTISDYITPAENATIEVSVEGNEISNDGLVEFASTLAGSVRSKTIEIINRGEEVLEISTVEMEGSTFTVSALDDSTLGFNEKGTFSVSFSPEASGQFQGVLEITSNAANAATFTIKFSGEGYEEGEVISIAEARKLPFGTRVTVGGRVTVANQFGGPSHIQDETAAIGVYWPPMHSEVALGDSVVVTGPLTEFNPIGGTEGDFLMQIAEYEGDDDITFDIIDTEPKPVIPEVVTIAGMNSGKFEAQLVVIQDVTINQTGSFQGETNYEIEDATGAGLIRIDGDVSSLVGASAPGEPVNIVGVVDQFAGDYQLKPRSAEDLGVEEIVYPGDDVSKDETFEVVTWNIEWFGSSSGGPDDLDIQYENVKTVIDSLDADLYAFQEISSSSRFADLIGELEAYGGIIASFSQSQKTAYLFKRATIDSLDSGMITENMTQSNWANGRYPLFFQFSVTIGEESREIFSYNIHAKAFDDADSYDQRENASRELKLYLDNTRSEDNVLFLGDYNDTITGSITAGEESPYDNFDNDPEYTIITKELEEKGLASQSSGSFIDHMTITSELLDEYISGTERVENTSYIGSYLSSTSDHYPIWTRFQFQQVVSNEEEVANQPLAFSLDQNYPNPFNPTTVISYNLAESSTVTLRVFDMLGREVATLVNNKRAAAGNHQVSFDASSLSSGVYIYLLSTANGQQLMRKMTLIK